MRRIQLTETKSSARWALPRAVLRFVGAAVPAAAVLAGAVALVGSRPSDAVHAAPVVAEPDQGIQVTGLLTYGSGVCFPDAVLLDCSGAVSHELRGPGGAGFFAPYVGQNVQINGAEQECQPGNKYLDVVTIQTVADPCGTPTATPVGGTPPAATSTPMPTPTLPGGGTPPTPGPSPTPPTAGNLALGKQLFASTTQAGTVPNSAADGDPATFWASHADRHPYYAAQNQQWIYIDLGQEYEVERMRMVWNQWRHARGYTVYAWLDFCGGWCRLASTTRGDGDDELVLPVSVESRYFMLWLVNPGLIGGHYELAEWEIGGEATVQTTNIAAGKSALALNHVTGFEAARAIDADDATDWRSSGTPTWIYVNFGSAYTVDRARVKWTAGLHADTFMFYAWAGSSWAPLAHRSGGTGADEVVRFPTVRTQYVLMYVPPGAAPGGSVGVRELEIYEAGTPSGGGGGTTPPGPPIPLVEPKGTWNGLEGGGLPEVVPHGLDQESTR